MTELPSREQMFANCAAAVNRASRELSEARDWLRSDWSPAGSSLTSTAGNARLSVLTGIAESKRLIEAMQREVAAAIDSFDTES